MLADELRQIIAAHHFLVFRNAFFATFRLVTLRRLAGVFFFAVFFFAGFADFRFGLIVVFI